FTTPISQYHRTNPHSHTHSLPTRRSSDLKTQAAAPILDEFDHITKVRNRTDTSIRFETDIDTTIRDFYWNYARDLVKVDTTSERVTMNLYTDTLTRQEKTELAKGKYFYEIHFSNKGGLVMPIILEWVYKDGS